MLKSNKNHCQIKTLPQSGRSMVEMLGTLAIVGVLSAGAIGGYSYAMNKHRTNELIYEATKRAQWVGTQLEMNNPNPSLNTFGTDSFGGGRFTGEVLQLENGQIGIKVAGLKEAVCQNILNSIGDNTVIREMKDVSCNDDNGIATLVFNRDLSTSDPTEIPEVSGEASGQATDAAPEETETTELAGDEECNYHGMWMPTTGGSGECYCNYGWGGNTCSEDLKASCNYHGINNGSGCLCDSEYGGSDCSMSARAACDDHGTWIYKSPGWGPSGFCSCDDNWGGNTCSENKSGVCGVHGTWRNNGCQCDTGWGGSDCSIEYCSGNGTWYGYFCECNHGWGGDDCSEDKRNACGTHGTWHNDSIYKGCVCNSGYGGPDCSQGEREVCLNHGIWLYYSPGHTCICDEGYGGSDCSKGAREVCNNHGTWHASQVHGSAGGYCECDLGRSGDNCDDPESTSTDYTPESTNG